jgi:hypothetical protein
MVGAWVIGECAGEQCGGLPFLVFHSKKYLPHREINSTILDRQNVDSRTTLKSKSNDCSLPSCVAASTRLLRAEGRDKEAFGRERWVKTSGATTAHGNLPA